MPNIEQKPLAFPLCYNIPFGLSATRTQITFNSKLAGEKCTKGSKPGHPEDKIFP